MCWSARLKWLQGERMTMSSRLLLLLPLGMTCPQSISAHCLTPSAVTGRMQDIVSIAAAAHMHAGNFLTPMQQPHEPLSGTPASTWTLSVSS